MIRKDHDRIEGERALAASDAKSMAQRSDVLDEDGRTSV